MIGKYNVDKPKNIWFPADYTPGPRNIADDKVNADSIGNYTAPIQFTRLRQDLKSWKDSINEAELAFYPHRVKMQRLFMDTVMNGHVIACIGKRKDQVILKDYAFYKGKDVIDGQGTELFKSKWFHELIAHAMDAQMFGYTLIELGPIVENAFPKLGIVRRENISPDRENVSSLIYGTSGIQFNDPSVVDNSGASFYDWNIWVTTPSERGVSKCGYGMLYRVALYEILLKNILTYNADYIEVFGQPFRWGKSDKFGTEEYDRLEASLRDAGSMAYAITGHNDEIEFINATGSGEGYKSYADFEARLEKKISKIILGHADAMDSTAGKLGSEQGDDSPVSQALRAHEIKDCRFIENMVNDQLVPKLISIGYPVPIGAVFRFKNDKEKEEFREKEDESNSVTATIAKTLFDAGLQMDAEYFTKRTGIPVEKIEPVVPEPTGFGADKQKKIANLYGNV